MIDSNNIIFYFVLFLVAVYITKSIKFTLSGIMSFLIGISFVGIVVYFNSKNKKIVKREFNKTISNLKLKKYPFINLEPQIIKILNIMNDFQNKNKESFNKLLVYLNKFFKNYYIINKFPDNDNNKLTENSIFYSKRILNTIASLGINQNIKLDYEKKLTLALKKFHTILNSYIEEMIFIYKQYIKRNNIDINFNPKILEYDPYPNDIETKYYSEHFSLY